MGKPRVKVVNPTEDWLGTEYYIGDKKIEHVKSVDLFVGIWQCFANPLAGALTRLCR